MKKVLLILILVLGTNITYSQGNLGETADQLEILFEDIGFTYTRLENKEDGVAMYMSMSKDSTIEMIHYLNKDGIVWGTLLVPLTDKEFVTHINIIDREYIRVEPDIWHNYQEDGYVIIKLITDNAEFPYFRILYKPYE